MDVIRVEGLTRHFSYFEKAPGVWGSVRSVFARKHQLRRAVDGITFKVREGEIVAFLGPNGAGKTTTLKMLAGIMHPTAGQARVLGHVPWARQKDFRMRIGVVMGRRSQLWPDLPAVETLELHRAIYEIDRRTFARTLDELVALFGLERLLAIPVRRLSLGERMKLELAAALLHDPAVLFLDEPTIGLDLPSQRAIRALIRTLNQRRRTTVMLTSHHLSDIETLCDRAIVINNGLIAYDGPLARINETLGARKTIRLIFSEPVPRTAVQRYGQPRPDTPPGPSDAADVLSVAFDVERAVVRDVCCRALAELPVADLTIEEAPLEAGVALLYERPRG
jgi:ABC-2 type transport system ATP-binding protein